MNYTYEDYRAFFYIDKLLDKMTAENGKEYSLVRWGKRLNILSEKEENLPAKKAFVVLCRKVKKLARMPEKLANDSLKQNLCFLQKLFSLTSEEMIIFESVFLEAKNSVMARFSSERLGICLNVRDFSTLTGIPEDNVRVLLKENSKLRQLGFIDTRTYKEEMYMPMSIRELIAGQYKDCEEMKQSMLGEKFKEGSWRAKDFLYIKETGFAVKLIKNCNKTQGFNILLYGMPGTGKTSFAQMLAASAKRKLFAVGEESNGNTERNARLQALYRKLNLVKKDKQNCLLFDEAEDIFSSKATLYNKVAINRLLENNTCPIIWTTNNIRSMDPAFVRRFTLAICFERPPVEVRQKIWAKHLKECHLPCAKTQTLQLAKDFIVPPALISGAAHAAALVKGDLNTVREHVSIMTRALRGGRKEPEETETQQDFNPQLIHADMDLNQLSKRLKELGRLDFSLCLYGASGTGKSAYARHLAEELGLDAVQRRASDLISPYVGETEQNIARAFAQAKEEKALLIFDEADSFLQDRSRAHRSWEISSVNEMLTWMESHPYPFICTTNLMDSLDPASLRRFSFKVKYDFLTPAQVKQAFKHFFGLTVEENWTADLPHLTPGDFALVKSKADILGVKQAGTLKEMLTAEQNLKTHRGKNTIGFCA